PIPPPAEKPPTGRNAASVPAPELPRASQGAARSEVESHISGDTPCSDRTRPTSHPWPCLPPCRSARKLPESTPTSLPVPIQPSSLPATESGYILNVLTALPPVTLCMARFGQLLRVAVRCMLRGESRSQKEIPLQDWHFVELIPIRRNTL